MKHNIDLKQHGIEEIIHATEICIKHRLVTPALILIYSGIDIAGWIASDEPQVRKRFTDWVDQFMLPAHPLPCKSIDLYAARCGVVHTFTGDSALSDNGHAARCCYAWGTSDARLLAEAADRNGMSGWVFLNIEGLLEAFVDGLDRFDEVSAANPVLKERADRKRNGNYREMSPAVVDELRAMSGLPPRPELQT